jgi:hypothetical protein
VWRSNHNLFLIAEIQYQLPFQHDPVLWVWRAISQVTSTICQHIWWNTISGNHSPLLQLASCLFVYIALLLGSGRLRSMKRAKPLRTNEDEENGWAVKVHFDYIPLNFILLSLSKYYRIRSDSCLSLSTDKGYLLIVCCSKRFHSFAGKKVVLELMDSLAIVKSSVFLSQQISINIT